MRAGSINPTGRIGEATLPNLGEATLAEAPYIKKAPVDVSQLGLECFYALAKKLFNEHALTGHFLWLSNTQHIEKCRSYIGKDTIVDCDASMVVGYVDSMHKVGGVRCVR